MSRIHWFGWISVAALIAFIVFAFRQGMQVKPDSRGDTGSGASLGSDGSDHGHGGGGHF